MDRERSFQNLECARLMALCFLVKGWIAERRQAAALQRAATIHDPADQTGAKMYIEPKLMSDRLTIICFATFFKGGDFMRECHARGCKVILVTKEKMLD